MPKSGEDASYAHCSIGHGVDTVTEYLKTKAYSSAGFGRLFGDCTEEGLLCEADIGEQSKTTTVVRATGIVAGELKLSEGIEVLLNTCERCLREAQDSIFAAVQRDVKIVSRILGTGS